jgi:hypothetical protein
MTKERPVFTVDQKWMQHGGGLAIWVIPAAWLLFLVLERVLPLFGIYFESGVDPKEPSFVDIMFLVTLPMVTLVGLLVLIIDSWGVAIMAFKDRIEVASGNWPTTWRERTVFPANSIESITAVPQFETKYVPGPIGSVGALGVGQWKGWRSILNTHRDSVPIVALDSTKEKLLIQCRNPVTVAVKLRELYSIPENPLHEIGPPQTEVNRDNV